MRKSTSCATEVSVLPGAGALAFFFEASFCTVQPLRCTNRAATSFSISSALSLPFSRMPMRRPSILPSFGARIAARLGVVDIGE